MLVFGSVGSHERHVSLRGAAVGKRSTRLGSQQRLPLARPPDLRQQRQQAVREGRHAVSQPLDEDAEQVEGLRVAAQQITCCTGCIVAKKDAPFDEQ